MRRPSVIYDFANCNCSILNFLLYEENLIFFFISAGMRATAGTPVREDPKKYKYKERR
jgi:hypothetical protein